jgi:hypothetical protein
MMRTLVTISSSAQPNSNSLLLMNKTFRRYAVAVAMTVFANVFVAPHAAAVEALLLEDTYVDNGTTGGKPPPNASNYGAGIDLRVFKGNGRLGRVFLKFSLATLPPGTLATDVSNARLRFWVNNNSTIAGSITLTPVATVWDEYTLKDNSTGNLIFGSPKIAELSVSSINNFISIDVTDWVRAWLSGTLVNQGIEIEASVSTATLNLAFDSKESNETSHEPRLEISLSRIGLAGPQGLPGVPGAAGVAGSTGPPGNAGPTGPAGSPGPQGLQGVAGPGGTKWLSWTGAPDQGLGILSDYYLDVATGDVWQKVSNEGRPVWALQGNIRGAQGPEGPKGDPGGVGTAGSPGPAGPAGFAGPTGPAGNNGNIGPIGLMGPIGPPGPPAVWPTRILPQGDLAMGEFTQGSLP